MNEVEILLLLRDLNQLFSLPFKELKDGKICQREGKTTESQGLISPWGLGVLRVGWGGDGVFLSPIEGWSV